MLSLPSITQGPLELADWLEMNVLLGKAGQASLDNLRAALKAGTLGQSLNASREEQTVQLEDTLACVRRELACRASLAGQAYPFRLRSSSLERVTRNNSRFSTYTFCLMLSYIPWEKRRVTGHFPERTFEELSCLVAKQYLGGDSLRFAWPRVTSQLPSQFEQAVNELCKRIGEGDGYRAADALDSEKDGGLDVVAWRTIDPRPGKLVLFGACATGGDWEDKLQELQPGDFCKTYFKGTVPLKPAKAFFTPRVVPPNRWRNYSNKAGLIFDRCRVSALAPELPSIKRHGDVQEWIKIAIERTSED